MSQVEHFKAQQSKSTHFYKVSLQSRIHRCCYQGKTFLVKRDDELSATISGSKMRKFSSFIGYLKNIDKVHVCAYGGHNANSTIGLAQLFKEAQISHQWFLKKPHQNQDGMPGNALLRKVLIAEKSITWVDSQKEAWHLYKKISQGKKNWHFCPEGANHKEALPGAMTIAYDIPLETIKDLSDIFVDSGTGLTAQGLILGLMHRAFHTSPGFEIPKIHVVLIAGNQDQFMKDLRQRQEATDSLHNSDLPIIEFHFPVTKKRFGGVSSEQISFIKKFAEETGIILDPLYNAKLFEKAYRFMQHEVEAHSTLVIHSGGSHAIHGFTESLAIK